MDRTNNRPCLNVQDACIMRAKNAYMEPKEWIIPDWLFAIEKSPNQYTENLEISASGQNPNIEVNIKALCSGDVNGSFIPER